MFAAHAPRWLTASRPGSVCRVGRHVSPHPTGVRGRSVAAGGSPSCRDDPSQRRFGFTGGSSGCRRTVCL